MIERHRPIFIDMDERARLVIGGHGKRDAELDWRERQAALDPGIRRIERADRLAAAPIIARFFKGFDQFWQDIVLNRHVIGRDVARGRAIQIALAHVQRVKPGCNRDLLDHPLGSHHTLRPAKPAKSRVGNRIRPAGVTGEPDMRVKIRIVRVKQRPVVDRSRQIRGITAARCLIECNRGDPAILGEAYIKRAKEIMPLAGHDHVIVAVEPAFDRPASPPRDQCRDTGKEIALSFLAAKPAAHPPDLDRDRVAGHTQDPRHHLLHFAWMLGRTVDQRLASFARNGECDVALKIKMILAANGQA